MKSLLLSTSDIEGGAARAAYRLHQGLLAIGHDSKMLVRARFSGQKSVLAEKSALTKLGPQMNSWPLKLGSYQTKTLFSSQWFPDAIAKNVAQLNPDIVNMHWVCNGFLKVETLPKLKKPLVWTLQDMWPFTGGCHYAETCDGYQKTCGQCPQLNSQKESDLSRKIWQRKQKAWQDINLTIVTPSQWMADCVRESSLFGHRRVEVIPFCLDVQKYHPADKGFSRDLLGLPSDKLIILFGALSATADLRKGFHLLQPALQKLSQAGWTDRIEVAIFGADAPAEPVDLGFKAHYLGSFADDLSLSIAYSAADVMIVPSLYESFGQTASEGLACGTPVVAFNAAGQKDIVSHQETGYLVKPYEVEDLAHGMAWVLEDTDRHHKLCEQARQAAVDRFSLEIQARQYRALFEELLAA